MVSAPEVRVVAERIHEKRRSIHQGFIRISLFQRYQQFPRPGLLRRCSMGDDLLQALHESRCVADR